jgi:hypothetical protein
MWEIENDKLLQPYTPSRYQKYTIKRIFSLILDAKLGKTVEIYILIASLLYNAVRIPTASIFTMLLPEVAEVICVD